MIKESVPHFSPRRGPVQIACQVFGWDWRRLSEEDHARFAVPKGFNWQHRSSYESNQKKQGAPAPVIYALPEILLLGMLSPLLVLLLHLHSTFFFCCCCFLLDQLTPYPLNTIYISRMEPKDDDGPTLRLYVLCKKSNWNPDPTLVHKCVGEGADVCEEVEKGQRVLHKLIEAGKIECIRVSQDHRGNRLDYSERVGHGPIALHCFVYESSIAARASKDKNTDHVPCAAVGLELDETRRPTWSEIQQGLCALFLCLHKFSSLGPAGS
eukprot:gene1-1_t